VRLSDFFPERLSSDLSRQIKPAFIELTSFKSLFLVKFQASTLDHGHHLLIKRSCCENLDAINAQYAAFCSHYCS